MTLQQLQYIIALDEHRHFVRAAEACHVTQATLSMMVQKLETELGAPLFDRSRQPIAPTVLGTKVLQHARLVCRQAAELQALAKESGHGDTGHVRLGIIPTVALYLLPEFLQKARMELPGIYWHITEDTTQTLIAALQANKLDMLILATEPPLGLQATPFMEDPFYLYLAPGEDLLEQETISLQSLDKSRLWLLAEGHCLRSQVVNICNILPMHTSTTSESSPHITYDAGSLETLKQMVALHGGYTLLPSVALPMLTEEEKLRIRPIKPQAPGRTLQLVTHATYPRHRLKKNLLSLLSR